MDFFAIHVCEYATREVAREMGDFALKHAHMCADNHIDNRCFWGSNEWYECFHS